jgi:hypothetical protein
MKKYEEFFKIADSFGGRYDSLIDDVVLKDRMRENLRKFAEMIDNDDPALAETNALIEFILLRK